MSHTQWWGTINVPEKNSFLLNSSAFTLAVEHKSNEWCLHVKRNKVLDIDSVDNHFNQTLGKFSPVYCGELSRHIVNSNTNTLEIKPSLADRTVVCRPKSPITLVPQASVIIYLSTPVWVTIGVTDSKYRLLKEVATQQLSDTWFGSSTREGELCYASQTLGRLDSANLPYRMQRAITPLLIENKADNDLVFERIALPVPSLSLYMTKSGQLCTQNVTLVRENDGDFAKLKLGQPKPELTLINGPRMVISHGQLIRAFSAIFS
ncbi:hypothetical protein NBRC116592_02200 [Colwellia sp. KU-HH00111]|uniref:hypothetical protein n=1 Tax=Colwellia sp. KU-HH00111 TaxID=3127652 RepID=UPI00310B0E30